jgi:Carboxypeptidase regulatory-like domain
MRPILVCVSLILLLTSVMVHAQGVGSSGDIRGTVTDASGAVLPKATVIVVDSQTGLRRTALTDSTGQFQLTGLSPATYDVTAQVSGFGTEIRKGVVVYVGQTAIADFQMKPSQVSTVVQVTGEPVVVDTERGGQADSINQQYISRLPISRRDYLTFTLLMPGVANSTRLTDDQDFRVKQTPQSGLSFYGSNGRGNSVTVDGGEANDDEGSVRLTLSQDAVQEFQINRSNYSAELGGASGASINIVSKSGTDYMHGSLYGFFRNDAMDARDPFAFSQALQPGVTFNPAAPDTQSRPIKNSLNRQQFGSAIGFPIKKDKTFFFGSFEGLRQDSQNAVPLLTTTSIFRPTMAQSNIIAGLTNAGNAGVPCIVGQPNLPAAVCAGILTSALIVDPNATAIPGLVNPALDSFIVNQFENNGGVFPYTTREYLGSARLDHHFDENNQVYLRYSYGHDLEESPDVQSLTGFSRGSSIHTFNHTLQGAWFHLFSARTQNEARVQWSYNNSNVIPNERAEVGLDIAGFANLGTNIFLPNFEILRRYEFADNLTMIRGHHTMRLGGYELLRGNHSESHIFFPGRFVFGPLPGGLVFPCLSVPQACGLSASGTTLDSLQSVALGLPIFLQIGFGNPVYANTRPWTAGYWQDSWAVLPNFTLNYGLRYELDSQYNPLNTPKHNFAPRVSFAWDPFRDHKTAIRGGYGMFYSPIYYVISGVDQTLGVLNKNGTAVENRGSGSQVANAVATCGILGAPMFPGNGSSPCLRQMSIYVDPIFVNSPQVFQGLFAQGGTPGVVGCTRPAPGNAACITPADLAPFGITVTNSGALPPLTVLFSNQPNYRSPYSEQAEFGIEREVAPGFSISATYIYSHTLRLPVAIDTNLLDPGTVSATLANGKTVTYRDWNSNPAFDPLGQTTAKCAGNPGACFVSPFIVQNNQYSSVGSALYHGGILEIKKAFSSHFTLMGSYTYSKALDTTTDYNSDYGPQDPLNLAADRAVSNFDERHKLVATGVFESPWDKGILSGFEVSPILKYNSGHPFNLLSGEATNGDNHPTNGRPIGAPRNSGLGPNYLDFDMRVGWRRQLGERYTLQVTAEGFNIANRTNYASVNNEVGALFAVPTAQGGAGSTTFNVHGSAAVSSSQPLGFTSVFPKREIQLGLRLNF